MAQKIPTPIVLLSFGLVALIGLIVLAATDTLDDNVRNILGAVVFAALTGAGVAVVPAHAHDDVAGAIVVDAGPVAPRVAGPAELVDETPIAGLSGGHAE